MRAARPADDRAGLPRRGHRASGREASARAARRGAPSAFVCATDTLAMGVLHTLAERGLAPGRDIAVVGFDDSQVAQVCPRASPRCASRWRTSPSRSSRRSRGSWATPTAPPRRPADPDPGGARVELAGRHFHRLPGESGSCQGERHLTRGTLPLTGRSVLAPPEVDRVVDLGARVLGQGRVGDRGRELDPDDALEVGARGERPAACRRAPASSPASTRTAPRPRGRAGGGSRAGTSRRTCERVGSLSITNAVPPRRTTRSSSARPGSQPGPKK